MNLRHLDVKKTICSLAAALLAFLMVQFEPAPAEAAPAKRAKGYQVQISSYQNKDKAEVEAGDLKQLGHEAYVEKIALKGKGVWYRVCIGRYKTRNAAVQAGRRLATSGMAGDFAVQEPGVAATPEKTNRKTERKTTAVSRRDTAKSKPAKPADAKPTKVPEAEPTKKADAKPTKVPEAEPTKKADAEPTKKAVAKPTKIIETKPTKIVDSKPVKPAPAQPAQTAQSVPQSAAVPAAPAKASSPPQQGAAEKKAAPAQPSASPFPKSDVFQSAMAEFNAGRYQEALLKFEEVGRENLDPAAREKVQRRVADCRYYLGIKGSNRDLLQAVDLYKELLQKYPNMREENQESLYRLAKSYVHLKFYYEARREFQNLYSQYHDSTHLPEAIYMMADMAYRTRNFPEAVSRYKEYLNKYPDGEYAQKSYFSAADSFSQLQQSDQADQWYGQALRKWALEEIPRDALLKMGYHYFRGKKHQESVRIFFFFLNLYPDDEMSRDVLYSIARSFMEMDQNGIALKMFSLLIERYPDSREAQESAVVMANIGVKKPGLKLPDIPGIQHYRDPLKVYNDMLAQSGTGEMTEGLLFQKGYALWKFGRQEESFEAFSLMARLFPQGRYKEEGIKNLLMTINHLVGKYYAKGDYLAIARLYFNTPESVLERDTDTEAVFHMGGAMKQIGLLFDSKRVFDGLLKRIPPGQENGHVLLALADIENRRGRYDEAEAILNQIAQQPNRGKAVLAGLQKLRGDILLRKGLYAKAASSYGEALSYGNDLENAAAFYRNYGFALKEADSCQSAVSNFQKALSLYNQGAKESKSYPKDVFVTSYQGLGQCYFKDKRFQEAAAMFKQSMISAPEGRESLWALFDMGRSYLKANSPAQADKAFTELKGRGGEAFWANVIDYTMRENAWTEKYAKYIR